MERLAREQLRAELERWRFRAVETRLRHEVTMLRLEARRLRAEMDVDEERRRKRRRRERSPDRYDVWDIPPNASMDAR
jgi:hypothetical protein